MIHPTAIVHPDARIGTDVEIGPFCLIGEHVEIGDRTRLLSNVVVNGHTTIGEDVVVHPFAMIGAPSQDRKSLPGEISYTTVGDRTTIREYTSIHRATGHGEVTSVGHDTLLLAYVHIAHNCKVGNFVTMSTSRSSPAIASSTTTRRSAATWACTNSCASGSTAWSAA